MNTKLAALLQISLLTAATATTAVASNPADGPRHPMRAPLAADASPAEAFEATESVDTPVLVAHPEASARFSYAQIYDMATGAIAEQPLPDADALKAASEEDLVSVGNLGSIEEVERAGRRNQKVFGTDSRTQVNTTTSFPNRTVCQLRVTFPNGAQIIASGVMIGRRHVLTSGAAVFSASRGGFARTIQVSPGRNGATRPFGSAFGSSIWSLPAYTVANLQTDNIAMVTLDRNIGSTTGFRTFGAVADVNGRTARITGYPADKPANTMWTASGTINSSIPTNCYYTIDTDQQNGQSGSGLVSSTGTVFGVHNGVATVLGFESNYGTRIDATKFLALQAAIAVSQ
jgi:glutamyl endopeptidase